MGALGSPHLIMYLPKHEHLSYKLQCPIKYMKKKQLMILIIKFSNISTNHLCLSNTYINSSFIFPFMFLRILQLVFGDYHQLFKRESTSMSSFGYFIQDAKFISKFIAFFYLKKKKYHTKFFYFFKNSFNLWSLLVVIILYHQTKTPISFLCR